MTKIFIDNRDFLVDGFDPRECKAGDLTGLRAEALREGLNVIETKDPQVYALVRVADRKIVEYSFTEILPSSRVTVKEDRETVEVQRGDNPIWSADEEIHCWHCYRRHGGIHCFEIVCTF